MIIEICEEKCAAVKCPNGGAYLCRRFRHIAESLESIKEILESRKILLTKKLNSKQELPDLNETIILQTEAKLEEVEMLLEELANK